MSWVRGGAESRETARRAERRRAALDSRMNVIIKIEGNLRPAPWVSLSPAVSCIFSYILKSLPPARDPRSATPLFNRFSRHKGWVLWGECNFLCVFSEGGDRRPRYHYATACWEYFNYKALTRFMIALPFVFINDREVK